MSSKWQVKHERVVRREEPSKDAKMLSYELRGKVVVGEEIVERGVTWLKTKFRGTTGQAVMSYMMIDGASVGLGTLLEAYVKPTPFRVVAERVAKRAQASTSAQALGQEAKGKTVFGVPMEVSGTQWIKTEDREGRDCFMMVDGSSLGLGLLLQKEEVVDPYDDGLEATPVQAKLGEAAAALAEALKDVPAELEIETRPKARLLMALEVLESTLHTVMDMDFTGRTRTIEDGMRMAKAGLKMAKEASDPEGEALAMDIIANAYLMKGQAEHAMKVAKEAQALFRRAGDKKGEARTLATLANCSCAKASRVMGGNRALSMSHIHPDKLEEFKRLQAEQLEEASRFAEDAVFLVKDKDSRIEVKAMLKAAVVDLSAGKAEKAKDTIDEASTLARKSKMPELVKECLNLCVDCADVHMKRSEWADAADVASELGAIFKAQGQRQRANEMIRLQIKAHVEGDEGQWALAAAKNDLVRLWKGFDKTQEALALHEVAKIYLAFREPQNVVSTSRDAMELLGKDQAQTQVKILRTMLQCHLVDEDKRDLKAAAKISEECLALGGDSGDKKVEAYGKLWTGRVGAEKFFEVYIPKVALWKSPGFSGKRNEKDLKIKDYERAMKMVDEAYLAFEKMEDEEGMQEAFETAYSIQQKTNSTQDPAKTTHIFKNGAYDHSEYSYDYAAVKKEDEEKAENAAAALVE